MSEKLGKSEWLCSDRRIDALFREGRWGRIGALRFCVAVRPAAEKAAVLAGNSSAGGAAGEIVPVAVLFSVPKKNFKRAWKRNLIKRRLRESYRRRKNGVIEAAKAAGVVVEIAFVCSPEVEKVAKSSAAVGKNSGQAGKTAAGTEKLMVTAGKTTMEIPEFFEIDESVGKILERVARQIGPGR